MRLISWRPWACQDVPHSHTEIYYAILQDDIDDPLEAHDQVANLALPLVPDEL